MNEIVPEIEYVTSLSPHKINPTYNAFMRSYPGILFNVQGKKAPSNINEEPIGHEETIEGVMNRIESVEKDIGDAPYGFIVSIENGLHKVNIRGRERWFDLAWVGVKRQGGELYLAHSTGIEFPIEFVEEAKNRGFATTTVGTVIAELTRASATDPHGFLTNYLISREETIELAIRSALGTFQRATRLN